jgi:hypothetical protein
MSLKRLMQPIGLIVHVPDLWMILNFDCGGKLFTGTLFLVKRLIHKKSLYLEISCLMWS